MSRLAPALSCIALSSAVALFACGDKDDDSGFEEDDDGGTHTTDTGHGHTLDSGGTGSTDGGGTDGGTADFDQWVRVRIIDKTDPSSGVYPGADVDSVQLYTGEADLYAESASCTPGTGQNADRSDCSALEGTKDLDNVTGGCDATATGVYNFGQGGEATVEIAPDRGVVEGDVLTVWECGAQAGDDGAALSVSVSKDGVDWFEVCSGAAKGGLSCLVPTLPD